MKLERENVYIPYPYKTFLQILIKKENKIKVIHNMTILEILEIFACYGQEFLLVRFNIYKSTNRNKHVKV